MLGCARLGGCSGEMRQQPPLPHMHRCAAYGCTTSHLTVGSLAASGSHCTASPPHYLFWKLMNRRAAAPSSLKTTTYASAMATHCQRKLYS